MLAFRKLPRAGSLAACILILVSCGRDARVDGPQGPELAARGADAPRPEPETAGRFEYLRYAADVTRDAPRICLTFSRALDPEVDYASYVAVTPRTPLALSVSGQTLCVGGIGFGEERRLTLRRGLPAADGGKLAADERIPVDFADRPAYVGFAGSGVILPRVDADGVAIETVNVDSVHIRLSRVNDRALAFRKITQGYTAGAGEYAWLSHEENPQGVGSLLWEGEMATGGPANAPVTTVVPLAKAIGRLEPGAYFMEIEQVTAEDSPSRPPARSVRWLVVTDLAVTAYRGADGLDVTVRSLQTAEAVRGVRVDLVARSNEILASDTSSRHGEVRFEGPITRGEEADAPRLLLAYGRNGDFAMLDLDRPPVDLSGHAVGGRAAPHGADAYVYLDRGIYRPGETVRATTLLRDDVGAAVVDRAGALVVFGPNGLEAARHRFETAEKAGGVAWDYAVPTAAARGRWRIEARLDGLGKVGEAAFSVEDFVPQRIALELDADTETPMKPKETRAVEADVRFLYGAPGAGLVVEGRARVEPDPNPFPDHEGFRYGRHDQRFSEVALELPRTVTDGAGLAVVEVSPGGTAADADRPLRLRTVISALEPGGRAVSDDVRLPYRPRKLYVGLRPRFEDDRSPEGEAVRFDVIALDARGEPRRAGLEWRLSRIDWTYDWYRQDDGRWRWRRSREVVPIESGRAATGGATAEIATQGLDWGDYQLIVRHPQTGVETSAGFWVGWGARPQNGVEAPDRVRLSAPAEPPAVGSRTEITLLAPYAGEAEVVVATDRVIDTVSVSVPEGGTAVRLPVTEEWGSGAYVLATVYTPRDAATNPKPRRAVGVLHVPVDMTRRTYEMTLDAPELVTPRQPLRVTVQAAAGPERERPWVTLAAVDEGILRLTRFASPDPVDWFFGRKRLGVDLHDDYGRLLDPNQGAVSPLLVGGDQIGGAGLTVVPTRTVALFSGPVQTNDAGRATIELEVPDFNGELRLMAVAWSRTGLGAAAQPLTVRDPVPAELVLPRFLAPGDEIEATATLDNVDGAPGTYAVTVAGSGPLTTGDGFEVELPRGKRRDTPVPVRAAAEGIGRLDLAVSGPRGFSVSRDYRLQVRSPWLPTTVVERALLEPGESYSPPTDALAGFTRGSGELQVSFAAIPMDAAALYDSLDRYPYGCTEQVLSRALPLLYADQMAALAGRDADGSARRGVQEAISTVLNRQAGDGAFGLWRMGDRAASPWLGAYVTDFLTRAAALGYPVPEAALERSYTVLAAIARGNLSQATGYDARFRKTPWQLDTKKRFEQRSAAYAHYVLARAGRADRSGLRYLHDDQIEAIASPLARAQVGAALALIGDRARARNAFEKAVAALGYENPGDYYQTPRRDVAGVLALAAEAGETALVERLAARAGRELPEPDRLTTQEKAFLLLAAHALAGDAASVRVSMRGAAHAEAEGRLYTFDRAGLRSGATFHNDGEQPVWRTTIARGAPTEPPPATGEGLTLDKQIYAVDGSPATLDAVARGERMIVSIGLEAEEMRRIPAVIVDLLPAGFEIEAVLKPEDAGKNGPYGWLGKLAVPRVAEARDDRFVAAIDLVNARPVRLAYVVRAVTPGRFALPGAVAEDMYRLDVFARSAARSVTIEAQ